MYKVRVMTSSRLNCCRVKNDQKTIVLAILRVCTFLCDIMDTEGLAREAV